MHTFVLVFGSRLGIPSTPILYLLRYRPPALSFPSRILATAILKAHHRHPLNLLAVLRWIPWGHYSPCYRPRALPLFAGRARYRWYLGWVAHRMRLRVRWVIRLEGTAVVLIGAGCDRGIRGDGRPVYVCREGMGGLLLMSRLLCHGPQAGVPITTL